MKKFTKEQEQEVVKMYLSGISSGKLSKMFNCSTTPIRRILYDNNIKPREYNKRTGCKFSYDIELNIFNKYNDGDTLVNLSKNYNCHESVIRKIIIRHGGFIRSPGASFREIPEDLIKLFIEKYNQGFSINWLAARYPYSNNNIINVLRKNGIKVRRDKAKGVRSGLWKGGRVIHDGYVYVLLYQEDEFYPMAQLSGYVLEHRLVMAKHLKRLLTRNETVHHIDGNKQNNSIENLQLRQSGHGKGVVMCCADCGSKNIIATKA